MTPRRSSRLTTFRTRECFRCNSSSRQIPLNVESLHLSICTIRLDSMHQRVFGAHPGGVILICAYHARSRFINPRRAIWAFPNASRDPPESGCTAIARSRRSLRCAMCHTSWPPTYTLTPSTMTNAGRLPNCTASFIPTASSPAQAADAVPSDHALSVRRILRASPGCPSELCRRIPA